MTLPRTFACGVAALAVVFGSAALHARETHAPTAPGTYQGWGPDIDSVTIVQSFRGADYARIAVEPLDTARVALPDRQDNTYEAVTQVLRGFTEQFVAGMKGHTTQAVEVNANPARSPGTLILRGKVETVDPGSRAKRYWGGFGAGAVRIEVRCEFVDGASGRVLASFHQQRRSGFGGFGGGYEELMGRTIRQVGEDTANILHQF